MCYLESQVTIILNVATLLEARFDYKRGMEHFLFILLIFSRLKSKRAQTEAKKSINKQRMQDSTLVIETSPNLLQ